MANIQRQGLRSWRLEPHGPALAASVHLGGLSRQMLESETKDGIPYWGCQLGRLGPTGKELRVTSQREAINARQ